MSNAKLSIILEKSTRCCNYYGDIEIEPGVKSVTLEGDGSKHARIVLTDVKKQFPDVEELIIEKNVEQINISNFMFPNIKNVNSRTKRFLNGSVLACDGRLLNVFCKKAGETIDLLSKIHRIEAHAMDGCTSVNFANDNKVTWIERDAISQSVIDSLPGSSFLIGHVLVKYQGTIINLNDSKMAVTCVMENDSDISVKKIITHNGQSVSALLSQKSITFDEIEIRDNNCTYQNSWRKFPQISLKNARMYKTVDDIIYTADMKTLIACPISKTGCITIPEGVETIGTEAFQGVKIESVKLPRTLRQIMDYAFENTSVSNVKFEYGLQIIHSHAFYGCNQLRKIQLPGSLLYIGEDAFSNVQKVYSEILPPGFFNTLIRKENEADVKEKKQENLILELHFNGCTQYLPKYASISNEQKETLALMLHFEISDTNKLLLWKSIKNTELKQETALQLYERNKDDELKKYLRYAAKNIAERYNKEGKEKELIKLLKMELMSYHALKKLQDQDCFVKNVTIKAYIMEAIENFRKKFPEKIGPGLNL